MKAIFFSFLFFTVAGLSFAVVSYSASDPIGKAAIGTQFRLIGFKVGICRDACISNWLTQYHGEAPGHQVMIVFVAFGIENPESFKEIVGGLPLESKSKILDRIAFAATDSGMEHEFTNTFSFAPKDLANKF
ncbi:MAG: hypothetical protein A4S09_08865 [Proteobacteria bacterium SG_bin7]|nr:MAG: hypothetical protein A4S09_08865 [Proteobacteria bacterium SG_bin7]